MTPVPPPGSHGGDGPRVAAALGVPVDRVLDLSASLNPFAPDVVGIVRRHLGALRHYPDVEQAEAALAAGLDLPRERLVLTAGGAQAIALLAQHLGAGRVDDPEFGLYRRHLAHLDDAAPRWRSDPHSPSGRLLPPEPSASEAAGRDDVWDEAFLPLSAAVWTRGRPGWSLGSLTKAFACPGLRLGYALAPDDELASALRWRRPAWAIDGTACAALPDLLALADPAGWTRRLAAARSDLVAVLAAHGLAAEAHDAPWVLVPGAAHLRVPLARHGVVVRDCSSFGLAGTVRIAVPDGSGLERLDAALRALSDRTDRPPPNDEHPRTRRP